MRNSSIAANARGPSAVRSLPARRLAREPRGDGRFLGRGRFGVARCRRDLAFEVGVVRQARKLIEVDERMLRRNIEFATAGLARDLVVEPQQVIPELRELGAVRIVRASGRAVL